MLRCLVNRVSTQVRHQAGIRSCQRMMSDFGDDIDEPQPMRFEKSINQINLLGRLGRDAEMRGSADHPVCVFSMATNQVFTKQNGQTVSHVDWHRVSVFRPGLREKVAANLKKGDRVYVTGTLRYDEYKDGNENLQRSATVIATDLVNLTKRYLNTEGMFEEEQM